MLLVISSTRISLRGASNSPPLMIVSRFREDPLTLGGSPGDLAGGGTGLGGDGNLIELGVGGNSVRSFFGARSCAF